MLGAAAWSGALLEGRTAPTSGPAADDAAAVPATPADRGSHDGAPLLDDVLSVMERRPLVVANLRQRVQIGEHELSGTGCYYQQGAGIQRRTRWQMQTLVAGETANLLQVFDGRFLWTDQHLPASRRVTRIDMVRLRRELNARGAADEEGEAGSVVDRGCAEFRGGLVQLLRELADRFDFTAEPATGSLATPCYALVGRWKPQELGGLWSPLPDAERAPEAWPTHLPHHVVLEVGREDLFPYRLEYRGAADAALAGLPGGGQASTPLARYEWFDVQFIATIEPEQFSYTAGEIDWVDRTDDALRRILEQRAAPRTAALPASTAP
jgi:hypothetical protein